MERPCQCGECHLCAVYAAAHGLTVKMPERQPTMDELAAFNDQADGRKKSTKRKERKPDDDAGLFTGVD